MVFFHKPFQVIAGIGTQILLVETLDFVVASLESLINEFELLTT